MKVTVMHVALTVLGLAASTFAAPALDGVSKQVDSHLEPACVDLWQDGVPQTLIQSNYCFPQNKCIPWQEYNNGAPEHVGIGAMNFEGTCCQLFAFDDCNESTGSNDYFLTCDPGVVPPQWRSKVNSILCYLPGQSEWDDWRHKRDEVKVAAAVPPLRFRYTVFDSHTIWAPLSKREQSVTPVTSTVALELLTISMTTGGVSCIKPTYPILNITISNTGQPDDLPVPTLTGHLPIVKRDHKVSDITERAFPTAFKTLTSVSYSKSTDTILNITITNEGRPNGPQNGSTTLSGHIPNAGEVSKPTTTDMVLNITITNEGRPTGPPHEATTLSGHGPNAAEFAKPTTTTLLPWPMLPTSGWLTGSGGPIHSSTRPHFISRLNITWVSSPLTAPTLTF